MKWFSGMAEQNHCCYEIKEAIVRQFISTWSDSSSDEPNGRLQVIKSDGGGVDYGMPIDYCPFCGEKIEVVCK